MELLSSLPQEQVLSQVGGICRSHPHCHVNPHGRLGVEYGKGMYRYSWEDENERRLTVWVIVTSPPYLLHNRCRTNQSSPARVCSPRTTPYLGNHHVNRSEQTSSDPGLPRAYTAFVSAIQHSIRVKTSSAHALTSHARVFPSIWLAKVKTGSK